MHISWGVRATRIAELHSSSETVGSLAADVAPPGAGIGAPPGLRSTTRNEWPQFWPISDRIGISPAANGCQLAPALS
eukprot:7151141-Alexandrium_andersonii.AAC.1